MKRLVLAAVLSSFFGLAAAANNGESGDYPGPLASSAGKTRAEVIAELRLAQKYNLIERGESGPRFWEAQYETRVAAFQHELASSRTLAKESVARGN